MNTKMCVNPNCMYINKIFPDINVPVINLNIKNCDLVNEGLTFIAIFLLLS